MNTAPAVVDTALPDGARRRGIDAASWSTLCHSLYPGARPESVLLVVDYCRARRLDPLKKPAHIVPMEVKDAKTNTYAWRDVVLPGIYELRTTAQRTGEYLGHSPTSWGPELDYKGVRTFEWCGLTVYRWHAGTGQRIEFPARVYFREVVTLNKEGKPNARWTRAPLQMMQKCCEASALREAFPDEIGGEHAAEELDGARIDETTVEDARVLPPKPDRFDDWLLDLTATADTGHAALVAAWRESPKPLREYLVAADPSTWTTIKTRAAAVDTRHATPAELPSSPELPTEPEP
jgi:phage recombination protein Bet